MARKVDTDELDRAARANWRVFELEQLRQLGLTEDDVRTMVRRGQLHRRHRGVYVYGHPDLSWQGEYLAAQHLGGDDAYLTRGSGLACVKLWRPYTREIHVSSEVARTSRDGVIIHRTRRPLLPDELRRDGPLRFAAFPRLLIDLAPDSDVDQMDRLITKAIQQGRCNHALMRTVLARYAGTPGAGLVTDAYAAYLPQPSARSTLERRWDAGMRERPRIPEPQRNIHLEAGGISWELDRYWPEFHTAVEVDGRSFHEALADRDKDELKRAKLLTIGIQTLHVSDWRIEYSIHDALDDLELIIARVRDQRRAM